MREGWKYCKLGDVGSFQRGGGFLKSDFVDNGFPCIHYGQIHTRFTTATYSHLTSIPKDIALNKSKIAHSGDVILAITSEDIEGSCKCTAWLGGYDVAVGGHTAIFHHTLNPAFVAYYFRGKHFSMAKARYARGFKVVEIKPDDIAKIEIAYPSLAEQERIVAELDLLTGIIDKQKQQLKELDNLAQSIFYDMFGDPVENEKGWDVKKLSDIGKVITGNTPSTKDDKNYSSDDYCFVKPSDIAKDGISIISDSEYHISAYGYENSRKLPKGSILTTCIGIIGKVGILSISATCNQQINAIIPKNSLESLYVANCIIGKRKTLESMANAPVVPIINKGDFSNISIPVPPFSLQQSFAQKIQSIESQKASINRSIAETQKLFDYTMDKYFG